MEVNHEGAGGPVVSLPKARNDDGDSGGKKRRGQAVHALSLVPSWQGAARGKDDDLSVWKPESGDLLRS